MAELILIKIFTTTRGRHIKLLDSRQYNSQLARISLSLKYLLLGDLPNMTRFMFKVQ